MVMRRSALLAAAILLGTLPLRAPAQHEAPAGKQTLYYIPHTHWEGAVFKTREEYLQMGLPNILKALSLLKQYPDFKFTLDQVAYIKPFLERYPEEAAAFRKYVKEGRLEIVGGMDVMPDEVKPGGEMFVRQMQYGKQYCREQLGVDVTVGWFLDTFGHHPQMPQLLKQAGYKSFWFCRGVPQDEIPSEFLWQGIDGTQMPAIWIPGFYGLFYGPPAQPADFNQFFEQRYNALNIHVHAPERVGLAGVDVSEPESYAPPLVAQFNRRANPPFTIRYSVPGEFAALVARRTDLPVRTDDFDPIFQGTYSSRIELKQRTREIEAQLLTTEKLDALARWLGAPADPTWLWRAWEPVLFNQTHDLASGVMTDHVYADVLRGYDFAQHLGAEVLQDRWERISAHIDTRGEGIPIVVFNPLGGSRSDAAEMEVGFIVRGVKDVGLTDAAGKPTPVQILESDRYEEGGLKRAKICFVARDVPALGYMTYHLLAKQTARPAAEETHEVSDRDTIENAFYRASFNRATGEIRSLFDKSQQWEALSGPANVVARQEDKGDFWELYHGLNGASYIAMKDQQPVPRSGTAQLSTAFTGQAGTIQEGPVFSEFRVSHPFAGGTFSTQVRLYQGLRRLDIRTELVNNEKYVRYQALFPLAVKQGHHVQEIPFGAIERPKGIEFPAQQWVDYSDGRQGVALLNYGLPGNLVNEDTLMLSLLRSHNVGGYGFGGGYEPGMSSDTGFELGRPIPFHYALIPHAGDWRQAAVYREGQAFNQPLVVRKAAAHSGDLPPQWGMVEISNPGILLTAFKTGPNGTAILRLYEAGGKPAPQVQIHLNAGVTSACEANLLEDSGRKYPVKNSTLLLDFHSFEIKTIQIRFSPMRTKSR